MFFYMPVKVYEGPNAVFSHADELAAMGSRALLVTGKNSARRCGAFQDVTDVLAAHGKTWVEFAEVEENPSVETVMKARDLGLKEEVDFVIGIGGGSPMDAAKAISLMIYYKDRDWKFLYHPVPENRRLPLTLIPTTAGTGSEATAMSILTRHDLQNKGSIPWRIFGDLALVDGKYLSSAPRAVLANTAMDALAHLMESYLNTTASDYSRMCADAGLQIWARSRDVLTGKRTATEKDFSNMMNASTIAGMAIAHTGTSIPHALSYRLTYSAHVPHGKACGYFLPGYVAESPKEDRNHVLKLAGFSDIDDLRHFYLNSCGPCEVSDEILEQTLQEVLQKPDKLALAPFIADKTSCRRIVSSMSN